MSKKIKNIAANEILSSGGTPTIAVTVEVDGGMTGTASVPFGASAGIHEASVLMDNDLKRYHGRGMLQVCHIINEVIGPKLIGKRVTDQAAIDSLMLKMDGTPQKKKLGGNSILAVSLAIARTAAIVMHQELFQYIRTTYHLTYKRWKLPQPMIVVIEGGKHADNSTDFQEYLLTVCGAPNVREAVRWGEETYESLRNILKSKGFNTNVGNEGAFAPAGIESNEAPLGFILAAIKKAGYEPRTQIGISLDPASSEFFNQKEQRYVLKCEHTALTSDQMIALYHEWSTKYPLISVEDGLAEDDWSGWTSFLKQYGNKFYIIGDDLTVTNPERVQLAIDRKACNAVLIKLNQIGTLSETIATIKLGQRQGFWQVVSHRGGGETNDTFMVDVAVAVNAEYIKVGPVRGERTEKYNRLMEIERMLLGKKS